LRILGISGLSHDSAACFVEDGTIRAAAEEERFSRRKHDDAFPVAAIAYCLEEAAVESASEIDFVVFHEQPRLVLDRMAQSLLAGPLHKAPKRLSALAPSWIPGRPGSRLAVEEAVRCVLPEFRGKMLYLPHHVSHAASAFFPSPFREAAILTIDGVGEWVTATIGHGSGNSLSILREQVFPNSLGLFFAAFAEYIGFGRTGGADRMMGLAGSGRPCYQSQLRDKVLRIAEDGTLELNEGYLDVRSFGRIATRKLVGLLGHGPRDPEAPIRDFDRDLAASVQKVTEDAVLAMARFARSLTGAENLCLAGGVVSNYLANARLRREGVFPAIWVQPACGNAGAALGAAVAAWHVYLDQPRAAPVRDSMNGASLGPAYASAEIIEFLDRFDLPHTILDRADIPLTVARLVDDGKTVGLLQGRMELGPRALGNRSILADPRRLDARTRINVEIKNREPSCSCACAVLAERAPEWFELDGDSDYMTAPAAVSRSEIPGAADVDKLIRLQTVRESVRPSLHAILRAFERLTGVPVMINTSFSGSGEPIVCSPIDAYRCMMRMDLDCIVLEDVLVWRHEQPGYDGDGANTVA
jgi:carbamoyltransferase